VTGRFDFCLREAVTFSGVPVQPRRDSFRLQGESTPKAAPFGAFAIVDRLNGRPELHRIG